MLLPQTAILSLSASSCDGCGNGGFVTLPFGLGYTWFEEMDYLVSGQVLDKEDPRRVSSLNNAVGIMVNVITSLIGEKKGWVPECIFLFGYSAGACLAMEICRAWAGPCCTCTPLGGAICVAGGIQHSITTTKQNKKTPILIMTGLKDDIYPPKAAIQSRHFYTSSSDKKDDDDDVVTIYTQPNKTHEMITKKEEIKVMMEFFGKRLVRRFVTMEGFVGTM